VSRYGQRKLSRMLTGLIVAALVAAGSYLFKRSSEQHRSRPAPVMRQPDALPKLDTAAMRKVQIRRVIDGDTLLTDGDERIRLIGVDTPETVHPNKPVQAFGKAASEFTRTQAEGRMMYLEAGYEKTDKYGRTLAFAYFGDGRLLNAEIIRKGFGHAYTQFPHPYLEHFRSLEKQAREQRVGLWADEPPAQR
jgi:micrococcal nuclease